MHHQRRVQIKGNRKSKSRIYLQKTKRRRDWFRGRGEGTESGEVSILNLVVRSCMMQCRSFGESSVWKTFYHIHNGKCCRLLRSRSRSTTQPYKEKHRGAQGWCIHCLNDRQLSRGSLLSSVAVFTVFHFIQYTC